MLNRASTIQSMWAFTPLARWKYGGGLSFLICLTIFCVEINKDDASENELWLFPQGLLQQGSQPPLTWPSADTRAEEQENLVVEKKEPLGEPRSEAVGVRKLWAGQREAKCSTWLVRVQTQLPLLGPQLEVQRKNRKLLSCYSSPSYLKPVVTVIVYSRISWQRWQTDFLQVWLQAGWLPGLVTGDNWLVSWPGCCRLWGRVLFLNTVWPSYICIANF